MKIESLQKLASKNSIRSYAQVIHVKDQLATWTNAFSLYQIKLAQPLVDGVYTSAMMPSNVPYPKFDSVIPRDEVELRDESQWLAKALEYVSAFKSSEAGKYCVAISNMSASIHPADSDAYGKKFSCAQLQILAELCKSNKISAKNLRAYEGPKHTGVWVIKNDTDTFKAVLIAMK